MKEKSIKKTINKINEIYPDLSDYLVPFCYKQLITYGKSDDDLKKILTPELISDYGVTIENTKDVTSKDTDDVLLKYISDANLSDDDANKLKSDEKLQNCLLDITEILAELNKNSISKEIKKAILDINNKESKTQNQSNLIHLIQKEKGLVAVYPKSNTKFPEKEVYYYDAELNTYQRFYVYMLEQYIVNINPKTHLQPLTYTKLLNRVNNIVIDETELIEMENCYININNYDIIMKDNEENKHLTSNKLTFYDTEKMLVYDPNLTIDSIAKSDMSEILKILYEITIPKGTNDTKIT